jgi:predicted Ser/Thr protein kinase
MKPEPSAAKDLMETRQPGESIEGDPSVEKIDIADAAEVARRLPQFEILELLGRGGMGVVYKARQIQLDRIVALKILPPDDAASPDFVERFRREAKSLAKLNHPNIVSVFDFGESGGLYYFVMEFVDGLNLRQTIQSRRMTPAEALAVVPPICEALQFAHEEGVVHRDIKPENILIDKKGRVKIADFGLAKLLQRPEADSRLTVSGATLGTPRYMAPEQIDNPERVDHRADIYSLGVVFYELLTGELPMGRFGPPSRKVQIDVRLDEIVLHALEQDVELRYQHAGDVKTDLEAVSKTPPPAPSPTEAAGKPWPVWIWWALLILAALPLLQTAELNRADELAGHGSRYGTPLAIKLALLTLGAVAIIKLVERWSEKGGRAPAAPFSQPWLGIAVALLGVCCLAVGPFPHVEWLQQTLQVFPQKMVNAAGATVELPAFSETFVQHGSDFRQGPVILAISALAAAFLLLAPRRPRWNIVRCILLSVAGGAIIFQIGSFEFHSPRPFAGSSEVLDLNAKSEPVYRQFRDDFRHQEAADAAEKDVPAEMLPPALLDALEKPHPRNIDLLLRQRLIASQRGFYSQFKFGDGGTVCACAAFGLVALGVMILWKTLRSSPAAFSGFIPMVQAWSGMLLLTPCLLLALFAGWEQNELWIPPGAVNPVVVDVPDHRWASTGVEFWQSRIIAAVCVAAILLLIAAALKVVRPGVRGVALSLAGVITIASAISFAVARQPTFTTVSWPDFLAAAQHGPAAPESPELRRILTERPRYVEEMASLQREAQARAAGLPPDSAEARKLALGPDVQLVRAPQDAQQWAAVFGLGLLLLGIADGLSAWKKRPEQQTPVDAPQTVSSISGV